jgi:sialate O-acetylesterase
MRLVKSCLLTLAGLLLAGAARADVKLHPIFSDNMVLQQEVELIVWGRADPGEKVTVELSRPIAAAAPMTAEATADRDGNWSAKLPA